MNIDKTVVLGDQLESSGSGKSENMAIEPGSILANRYKVISKLGEGGMGIVYQGVDTQLERLVAIKLLKRKLSEDPKAIENLKQEAQVSMILTHPGIMRLINFEHHGSYAFLLVELVDGMDLKTIAKRRGGKLDSKTTANITYKLCAALEYAHKNNVIHRDIKPANIMISSKKEVKLMDFGIARVLLAGDGARPQLAGTLAYLAPELIGGAKPDARCDIYALGLTMYELLAGEHPYKGMSAQQVIKAHVNTDPPPIEGVDRELYNIVSQCIEKKPNARFQTVADLRGALGKYLGLDESYKVSRMKATMEHEKRKLEIEQQKVATKLEMLQTEMKRIESRPAVFGDTGPGFSLFGFSREGVKIQFPLILIALAAAAGVGGAILGEKTQAGILYDAGSDEANMAAAMALMGIMALMPP
ncbi:MAG: serine/threonine protein kinase, partial [Nitrospinota bacterium]|nr:serine/threonine protein kinase [Nitrospinota bacterium]